MRTFCTLFDRHYLPYGLALHSSLTRWHARPFRLYMLAMDKTCEEALRTLQLENVVVVSLEQVVGHDLAWIHGRMNFGQICWTSQPLLCRHVLDRCGAEEATYLEADSYFFADPQLLFDEIGTHSVSLVPHRYAPGLDQTAVSGVFCVQFNLFRNDPAGRELLAIWEQACLLYDKQRSLWYPGQVCMDSWPERSAAVCVVQHKGAGVGPWNVPGMRIGQRDGRPTVDDQPVVFFHFHQVARMDDGTYYLSNYPLGQAAIDLLYKPYLSELERQRRMLRERIPGFDHFRAYHPPRFWPSLLSLDLARWRAYRVYLGIRAARRQNFIRSEEPA
jgi:hypothetical protein